VGIACTTSRTVSGNGQRSSGGEALAEVRTPRAVGAGRRVAGLSGDL
jgi:hypothetical protein